jgi:hypothetical protein
VYLPDYRNGGAQGFTIGDTASPYPEFGGLCANPDGSPAALSQLGGSAYLFDAPS